MKFFGLRKEGKNSSAPGTKQVKQDLGFYSTAALERGLDGGFDRYSDYIFAIYHCRPDEEAGINDRREELRKLMPTKVVNIGDQFVLMGEAAFQALAAYYQALIACETLSDEYRAYASERLEQIAAAHRASQSLPIPIDLTEGQLSQDHRLEFLTCLAISNGQVRAREA
jgi:hypothetical protein